MDAIRVSKVEQVLFSKSGSTSVGTIHLTAHHIIFRYDDAGEKEMWMPYPLISLVNRLPQTLQGQSILNFHTRTFESFSLTFKRDSDASDVFESVKELTVATSVSQLYAFYYVPTPPLPTNDGWTLYSPRDEYIRMGVGTRSKAWRFTDLNKDYSFCPTYPARLVVPTRISDTTLQYASKYRSKCRIPILSYLHWANYGSITRSSQPMVGITQNRSVQDEKLIEAIFQSHWSPESRVSNANVYGATPTNLIIDARPTVNAVANTAKGAGTENMEYYKEGKKVYLGIDHIHAMRESLAKVVEALREADQLLASINSDLPDQVSGLAILDKGALRRSGWLRHISAILEGTLIITKNVHINSSHVLIHCSDGWDRTSQLSALTQLCLDPFYRTIRGFEILIEKDWLAFGHKFLDRCGHLSSDKFFLSPTGDAGTGSGAEAAQAFLASMQNRFASQNHIKETSPVFHQFLESVRQIQRQYPDRFEFNERFLKQLYYHLYSCQFGTFLFNCEKDRKVGDGGPPPIERTVSVWDFFNSPAEMALNRNPTYDATLDDPSRRTPDADMGVLLPNPKDVRFWHELYGRTDEEMNGRFVVAQARDAELVGPVDSADDDPVIQESNTQDALSSSGSGGKVVDRSLASSLSVLSAIGRPTSPGLGTSMRDISASLPDLPSSQPRAAPSRSPAHTPVSLPDRGQPSPLSQGLLNTPIWSRAKPPDILSGGGVKSVWGKLSSNASAAFSVVQDAYAGVAKDLMNTGQGMEEGSEKTSELKGRDMLSAWGQDRPSSSPRPSSYQPQRAPATMPNPWSTAQSSSSAHHLTIFDENPWGAPAESEPLPITTTRPTIDEPTSPLPLDPTVTHIPIGFGSSSRASASRAASISSVGRNSPQPGPKRIPPQSPPCASQNDNTDPLGVGLL
ncbi:protein phosphatase [Pholiota conissans]|uniref:Protein phosphatase n=1 Tax=Pholiota conissans TaxID=109636 RepID=A0A9P5ZDH1_9AGAR|nr:protein phosphatase [Pholiota conissans]